MTSYIDQILKRLKKLNPYKVILFGSHAYGNVDENSDIDLMVVLNTEDMPENFKEKMKYKLSVRDAILDISKKVPIDLIVYTKSMYRKFIGLKSLFSKEILQKGKILYEADN